MRAMVVAVTEESTSETEIAIRQSGAALTVSPTSASVRRSRSVRRVARPVANRIAVITRAATIVRMEMTVSGGMADTAILVNM